MRDDQNVAFRGIWVLQIWAVVVLSDIGDEGIKTADHIFWGSGERVSSATISTTGRSHITLTKLSTQLVTSLPLKGKDNSLSTRTSVCPNIPRPQPLLLPLRPNLLTRQPLIIPILPLANRLRHLDPSLGADRLVGLGLAGLAPGESFFAAEFEEFEGSLGAGAGGDVAGPCSFSIAFQFFVPILWV